MTPLSRRWGSLFVVGSLAVGCAKAREAPQAPEAAPPPQPGAYQPADAPEEESADAVTSMEEPIDSVDEAQALLDSAHAELDGLFGAPDAEGAAPPAGAAADELGGKRQADRCATACRAMASMKRAGDAVCRLTSEDDERCATARSKVDEAAKRVAVCSCSEG